MGVYAHLAAQPPNGHEWPSHAKPTRNRSGITNDRSWSLFEICSRLRSDFPSMLPPKAMNMEQYWSKTDLTIARATTALAIQPIPHARTDARGDKENSDGGCHNWDQGPRHERKCGENGYEEQHHDGERQVAKALVDDLNSSFHNLTFLCPASGRDNDWFLATVSITRFIVAPLHSAYSRCVHTHSEQLLCREHR